MHVILVLKWKGYMLYRVECIILYYMTVARNLLTQYKDLLINQLGITQLYLLCKLVMYTLQMLDMQYI